MDRTLTPWVVASMHRMMVRRRLVPGFQALQFRTFALMVCKAGFCVHAPQGDGPASSWLSLEVKAPYYS